MHINYSPEFGFSWLETLLGRPAIKAVWNQLGDAGVYYVLAYGLPISPHSYEFDEQNRDMLVMDEIKLRKIACKIKNFPTAFYKDDTCKTAIDQAAQMICTPSQIYFMILSRRIAAHEEHMNADVWDKDPEKRGKALEAEQKSFNLIKAYRGDQRVEEKHINSMMSRTGVISMDELFD